MNEIEFSYLCGVTPLTIQNRESKSGELTLRKNSRESLEEIEKFTKRKAWKELSDIIGSSPWFVPPFATTRANVAKEITRSAKEYIARLWRNEECRNHILTDRYAPMVNYEC